MRRLKLLSLGLVAAVALAACAEEEFVLPGPREPIRPETAAPTENVARAFQGGPTVANAAWTHVNGSPSHVIRQPALGRQLSRVWSADIGDGNGRRHRLTADPVVAGGRVFTLDSRSQLSAFSTAGAAQWSRDLTPPSDNADDASGGGIAYAGGRVFATTGFGTITVFSADTGAPGWSQDLDAAATGAPTVADGVVYVTTRNDIGWAIDADTGRILWQVLGAPSESGLVGGASPAVAGRLVVFAFSSGQLIAVERGSGRRAWLGSVAGARENRAFSQISDITGGPIADGARVFAGNHSGRSAAFDAATGAPVWSADVGTLNTMWRAGDSVFLVSDENQLVRLDAATGDQVWSVALPFFEEDRQSRRKATFVHYGPVLAGGRLLVASDDGFLRSFDPVDGRSLGDVELPDAAARSPVIAGGTLYLVTEGGQIHAFR
ncbi:MAG: PQQ-binding-like beta-propeller repeat protein [Pseudomonadota bacterium]